MTVVLDASALLAWLIDEPGAEIVDNLLPDAVMSSLNWSEVVQKAIAREVDVTGFRVDMESTGLRILPFNKADAERAALLWMMDNSLSLADRACLSLALENKWATWTADRHWTRVSMDVEVHLIRHKE